MSDRFNAGLRQALEFGASLQGRSPGLQQPEAPAASAVEHPSANVGVHEAPDVRAAGNRAVDTGYGSPVELDAPQVQIREQAVQRLPIRIVPEFNFVDPDGRPLVLPGAAPELDVPSPALRGLVAGEPAAEELATPATVRGRQPGLMDRVNGWFHQQGGGVAERAVEAEPQSQPHPQPQAQPKPSARHGITIESFGKIFGGNDGGVPPAVDAPAEPRGIQLPGVAKQVVESLDGSAHGAREVLDGPMSAAARGQFSRAVHAFKGLL